MKFGETNFETVLPSVSVLAKPSVAAVDSIVDKRGTRKVPESDLQYLYSREGQEIIARNFYRPRDSAVAAKYAKVFPTIMLATIKDFGGWDKDVEKRARNSWRSG